MSRENKKKRPLRRAEHWGRQLPGMTGRLAGLMIAIVVMGLMFSALQAIGTIWLRIALSAAILTGMLLLCLHEGMAKGAADAAASRAYESMAARELPVSQREDAACYHPLKAFCAAAILFAVPLGLSVYVAMTAREYTYALQDLPAWVTQAYGTRADVMAPLGAYTQEMVIATSDYLRILARLPIMIAINLFPDPLTMTGLIDRLTPLFMACYPACYVIGYLRGPAVNRKREKENRRAKKIAVRKAQKKGLAAELTGSHAQVHYGHKAQEAARHKKKELV